MDSALLMVSTRLNQVRRYPVDADEPVVMLSNSEKFIAWFILNVRPPSEAEIDEFVAKHPNLKEGLDRVRSTSNSSLKMLRLREFAALRAPPGAGSPTRRVPAPRLARCRPFDGGHNPGRMPHPGGVVAAEAPILPHL